MDCERLAVQANLIGVSRPARAIARTGSTHPPGSENRNLNARKVFRANAVFFQSKAFKGFGAITTPNPTPANIIQTVLIDYQLYIHKGCNLCRIGTQSGGIIQSLC